MKRMMLKSFICVLMMTLVGACSLRDEIPENTEFVVKAESFSFASADYNAIPEYRVQAGDVLDVLFNVQSWNPEKEYYLALGDSISIRFPEVPVLDQIKIKIPPDGSISMPYIGMVKVQGLGVKELKKTLEKRYQGILRQPELYITIDDYLFQLYSLKEDLRTAPRGLSRLATVRPDGYVTFPLIGDVLTSDKTIPQLNAYINQEYEKISHSLQANLFLQTHSASHIYVVGAVERPGAYEIAKPLTIMQAIALAGGNTVNSDFEEVFIARRHEKKVIARRVNIAELLSLRENSSFFFVGPDDIIYVPPTRLATIANVSKNLAQIILFRGWSANIGFDLGGIDLLGNGNN